MIFSDYSQSQPIGQWNVIYMGEIPGYPGIWGKSKLSLFENGFSISSSKLENHFFSYSCVTNWVILKERSAYASANSNAFFDPRHIRIQYFDEYYNEHVILLEMVQSIFLPKNAKICREILSILNRHNIFTKFASAKS